jgi:hypothetical protein
MLNRRKVIGFALLGTTFLSATRFARSADVDEISSALERATDAADSLTRQIATEPIPLKEDVVEFFLQQDRALRARLAEELSAAPPEELLKFIRSDAVELVAVMDAYDVPLVPTAQEIALPELKPAFPLPSPPAPRAETTGAIDVVLDSILIVMGVDDENDREQVRAVFHLVLRDTPGGQAAFDQVMRDLATLDWTKVTESALTLIFVLYSGKFIYHLLNRLTRVLGEEAGERIAKKIIATAALRFVAFVCSARFCYQIILALNVLARRLR